MVVAISPPPSAPSSAPPTSTSPTSAQPSPPASAPTVRKLQTSRPCTASHNREYGYREPSRVERIRVQSARGVRLGDPPRDTALAALSNVPSTATPSSPTPLRALGIDEVRAIEAREAALSSLEGTLRSALRVRGSSRALCAAVATKYQAALVSALAQLRDTSLAVVHAAQQWRVQPHAHGPSLLKRSGTLCAVPEPFTWRGVNYLLKMVMDLDPCALRAPNPRAPARAAPPEPPRRLGRPASSPQVPAAHRLRPLPAALARRPGGQLARLPAARRRRRRDALADWHLLRAAGEPRGAAGVRVGGALAAARGLPARRRAVRHDEPLGAVGEQGARAGETEPLHPTPRAHDACCDTGT